MKRLFASVLLVLALSVATFAGDVQTPGAPAPTAQTATTGTDGQLVVAALRELLMFGASFIF